MTEFQILSTELKILAFHWFKLDFKFCRQNFKLYQYFLTELKIQFRTSEQCPKRFKDYIFIFIQVILSARCKNTHVHELYAIILCSAYVQLKGQLTCSGPMFSHMSCSWMDNASLWVMLYPWIMHWSAATSIEFSVIIIPWHVLNG